MQEEHERNSEYPYPDETCPACGAEKDEIYLVKIESDGDGDSEWPYPHWRCRNCGEPLTLY